MKPTTIIVLSTLISSTILLLTQQYGCGWIHDKTAVKDTVQDGAAMAECISKHWGEDWQNLIANCAGPGLEIFYDMVADTESAINKQNQMASPVASNSINDAGPIRKIAAIIGKKSYYASQPPIATRLARRP